MYSMTYQNDDSITLKADISMTPFDIKGELCKEVLSDAKPVAREGNDALDEDRSSNSGFLLYTEYTSRFTMP